MSSSCHFPSNPDISGIGVRAAIYIQNLLCFVPAVWAIWDGEVSDYELESAETQATTNLILAFAILVSCIVQALTGGLTSYQTSLVLSLSWMNNTNVFIYFLLYVQYKGQPGVGQLEPRWSVWARHFGGRIASLFRGIDVPAIDSPTDAGDQEAKGEAGETREPDFRARRIAKLLFQRVTLFLGSVHLTLMAALGIWLWSNPQGFGNSESATCATGYASVAIVGHRVPFGSSALRILSLVIYSLFIMPGINLLLPVALFLSVYFWHHPRRAKLTPQPEDRVPQQAKLLRSIYRRAISSRVLPTYIGLCILLTINIVFIVDIELTLERNEHLQDGQNDSEWGFGQILSLLLIFMPVRDLVETILARRERRQELAARKEKLNVAFLNAIYRRDLDKILHLVKQGVDPNLKTEDGLSALEVWTPNVDLERPGDYNIWPLSSNKGVWESVRTLVNAGADLNVPFAGSLGFGTVLQAACGFPEPESHEMITFLLGKGADPNIVVKGNNGTALLAACKQGPSNLRAVEILLNAGVDVNAQGSLGPRPHMGGDIPGWPRMEVDVTMDEAIYNFRFRPRRIGDHYLKDGEVAYGTALQLVCEKNYVEIAALLLDKAADIQIDAGTDQPLRIACGTEGSLEMVKLLLDRGADPNMMGRYGTPLHTAVSAYREWSVEVVKLLLERGANPDALATEANSQKKVAAIFRDTPLFMICETSCDGAIRSMVCGGTHATPRTKAIFAANKGGWFNTPLTSELQKISFATAELLLDHGADPHFIDAVQTTLLQAACSVDHHSLDIIRLLLDRGVDPNVISGKHGTALQAACSAGSLPFVELLLDRGANPNIAGGQYGTPLQAACKRDCLNIVKILLDRGADPSIHGGMYVTPLRAACESGRDAFALVQFLLDMKMDPRVGWPLKAACFHGNADVVQILLERGADPNEDDGAAEVATELKRPGGRPLHVAVRGYLSDDKHRGTRILCVEHLLAYGADVNSRDESGKTVLGLAREASEHTTDDIVELLLQHGALE